MPATLNRVGKHFVRLGDLTESPCTRGTRDIRMVPFCQISIGGVNAGGGFVSRNVSFRQGCVN
ncbi:hypothetical protein SBA2_590043 [Acidobacteriia bacterium SbA2]|nr:hypothetical protein SBA2_590043 [Acidobacteriia bacterium SbA2]